MSTYITYPTDATLKNLSFCKSNDKYKKIYKTSDLHEFNSLSHKDILIYLIPSSLVSSYKFEKNPKISNQNNHFHSSCCQIQMKKFVKLLMS